MSASTVCKPAEPAASPPLETRPLSFEQWPTVWHDIYSTTYEDDRLKDIQLANSIVCDLELAADVVQQAGKELAEAIGNGRLDNEGQIVCIDKEGNVTTPPVRNWYVGVVKHKALDAVRKQISERKRGELTEDGELPVDAKCDEPLPDIQTDAAQLSALTQRMLSHLGPRVRAVVQLRVIEGIPQAEVAKRLGFPTSNSVASALGAALAILRKEFRAELAAHKS